MLKVISFLSLCALATFPPLGAEDIAPQGHYEHEQGFAPFTGRIVGHKVRMRTQPSLEAHVVRETNYGELFAVEKETGEFFAVRPEKGAKGYVFRTYVLDGVVEGNRVNVRLYPDMDAPVIARLNSGDRVDAEVSPVNNKWLEIDLSDLTQFYVAKEFLDNIGPVETLAQMEERHHEANHLLNAAFLFAQAEIQKPFEQVDLDTIDQKFAMIAREYSEFPEITQKAEESLRLMQDAYIEKKIAFLEAKSEDQAIADAGKHLQKVLDMGREISRVTEVGQAASETLGMGALTDKMRSWVPFEEAMFHLWAAANEGKDVNDFYREEEINATMLTGIVEAYDRPVKNKPGDYLLRSENLPVAFLYSTKVDLHEMIGKNITVVAAPRPNHNFAFPAYFVISVE